ncbi:MAG TPA: TonB-dependent receptor [Gammaproteobacteria bacterium]|nr:TonB-dependent receptor [Gammaproteobacteria bacterium]
MTYDIHRARAGSARLSTRARGAAAALSVAIAAAVTPARAQDLEAGAGAALGSVVEEVTVTARRRAESAQEVPIPVSVVNRAQIEDTGSFNVNRVKELIPTVQLYSSNPRNTAVNIRGLGTTFGLTNDGIDAGVGFYVDGVFYARPAATTLDFIDVEQLEVLRGPQGTLFGKNTTAGAITVVTRKPSFDPEYDFEVGAGNDGFGQLKGSLSGPLGEKVAGRLSFSRTRRDGNLYNVATGEKVNELDNTGFRGQLLFTPTDRTDVTLAIDNARQRPNGYAQVLAGVAPTLRPAYRQFDAIIADLGYTPPSLNPFDRLIDHDTPWKSNQDLGGLSVNVDWQVGPGTFTSTTAWRYWTWDPSNDRDFTALPVLAKSQGNSKQTQWTQEVRYAGAFSPRLSGVAGLFAFGQTIEADPVQTEESGPAQWRFSQSTTSPLWQTPGLLDGYGIDTMPTSEGKSVALFGQLDWAVTERLSLLPGVRFNYDEKKVDFNRVVYGGLQTSDPQLIALQRLVYAPQRFVADVDDTNTSGQVTLKFRANDKLNAYATYATSYKPVGLNVGGLPTDAAGNAILSAAVIKPEDVSHVEIGLKSTPTRRSMLNFTLYDTHVEDYQTQVQNGQLGVNRGYLANAEKVRVRGAELDGRVSVGEHWALHTSIAYTDGKYVSFTDAPAPLEETGGPAASKDISGSVLPGISKWAGSFGGEVHAPVRGRGEIFGGWDIYYRDDFSSSPTPSAYLNVDGYSLLNLRVGYRAPNGWTGYLWARNALDEEYFEQLLPAGGNAGQYAAVLGDPRTVGLTFRFSF